MLELRKSALPLTLQAAPFHPEGLPSSLVFDTFTIHITICMKLCEQHREKRGVSDTHVHTHAETVSIYLEQKLRHLYFFRYRTENLTRGPTETFGWL